VDAVQECLVPYDFDWSTDRAITDAWFHELYSQLPYRTDFIGIFDCCHSGGMTRAGVPRVRGINPPDDVRHRALRWDPAHDMWVDRDFKPTNRGFLERKSDGRDAASETELVMTDRLGYAMSLRSLDRAEYKRIRRERGHEGPYMPLLLYACRANELSYEYQHGAIHHGAFTFSLAKNLRQQQKEKGVRPTYRQLIARVDREMGRLGYDQRPTLTGPSERLADKVPKLM